MSTQFPDQVLIKRDGSHIVVMKQRLRMSHALKLYYNRMHYWITNLPEGHQAQRNYFIREASETLLQINEIEQKGFESKFNKNANAFTS